MELEVFVHGALCIAYSGRCLLSGYFNRRDPNQGTCTNACRWNYSPRQAGSDDNDRRVPSPSSWRAISTLPRRSLRRKQSFAACGGGTRHPLADQVYLLEEKSAPASSCRSWKTSTAPTS
jgi:putative protease